MAGEAQRKGGFTPYALLAPGMVWLILFFMVPIWFLLQTALSKADAVGNTSFVWKWSNFSDSWTLYQHQYLLSFMVLPIYVSLEKIDVRLLDAARDLFSNPFRAFRKVVLPLSLPGIFAGSLLVFIPAAGDFVNSALLGSPQTRMIGNVVEGNF